MTADLINRSQNGDDDATLTLIEKFNPLLRKYAYMLFYDDAYNDLLADFIEILHNLRLDQIREKNEGNLVSYLCTSIHSSYIKKLTAIKKNNNFILYSELSDSELYFADTIAATCDSYFDVEMQDIYKVLTTPETRVIKLIYLSGYTVTETAELYGLSRQAVNQMKKRALKKIADLFSDEP